MGWFFKSDMEIAEELRRKKQITEGDKLLQAKRLKDDNERRLQQLDDDLYELLGRKDQIPTFFGLSAWLPDHDIDSLRPREHSRAKDRITMLIRAMTEPKDKPEQPKRKR